VIILVDMKKVNLVQATNEVCLTAQNRVPKIEIIYWDEILESKNAISTSSNAVKLMANI
jgi:hypothetical protein